MPRRDDISKILVIGSGPIIIGQSAEFDYSGTQACKALKSEGYEVVLVNSNPATIMTDPETADRTYIEPLTAAYVEEIIRVEALSLDEARTGSARGASAQEQFALLPTVGGQTALNLAVELADSGVLEKYNVELIGAQFGAIKKAEDRLLFQGCDGQDRARSAALLAGQQPARRARFHGENRFSLHRAPLLYARRIGRRHRLQPRRADGDPVPRA